MRVTLETLLTDGLGVDHFVCNGAMGVVTIRATNFAFPNGVMGLSQHLSAYFLVTFDTSLFRIFFSEVIRIVFVDVVTAGAGKIPVLVPAALP
jgi:hypothetical protein